MPVKPPDRREQQIRGQFVDVLVATRCGLYTYYQAGRRLGYTEETIRQYTKAGHFQRVYLASTPLLTEESIQAYERSRKKSRN